MVAERIERPDCRKGRFDGYSRPLVPRRVAWEWLKQQASNRRWFVTCMIERAMLCGRSPAGEGKVGERKL